jgi:hypothetical protein
MEARQTPDLLLVARICCGRASMAEAVREFIVAGGPSDCPLQPERGLELPEVCRGTLLCVSKVQM